MYSFSSSELLPFWFEGDKKVDVSLYLCNGEKCLCICFRTLN